MYDLESLQLQWAREHNLSVDYTFEHDDKMQVLLDILVSQLRRFKPDVLLVHNARMHEGGLWQYIREKVPTIKWVTATITAHLRNNMQTYGVNSFLCAIPSFMSDKYCGDKKRELFYYCYDAQPTVTKRTIPLSFFGSTGNCSTKHHRKRYEYLLNFLTKTPIQIYGREAAPPRSNALDSQWKSWRNQLNHNPRGTDIYALCKNICDRNNHKLPPLSFFFKESIRPCLFGKQYEKGLQHSLVTMNIHTEFARGDVGNMRMFEATGNGTCMMVEESSNLKDLFEPDKEVVTYKNIPEAIDKARWLLDNPTSALEIGMAGHARTKKCHGIKNRTIQAINHLKNHLK